MISCNTLCLMDDFFFRKRAKNWQAHYRCKRCFMLLPNACSFSAHQRIHDKSGPYVCPVCGECMEGDRNYFLKHVKLKCMHFFLKMRMDCPYCTEGNPFTLGNELDNHILTQHVETFYKCANCAMAYRSADAVADHHTEMHTSPEDIDSYEAPVPITVYRCSCCRKVVTSLKDLQEHLSEKISEAATERSVTNMLHCPHCPHASSSMPNFKKHILLKHGVHQVDEICSICGTESRLTRDHLIHKVLRHTDYPNLVLATKKRTLSSDETPIEKSASLKSPSRKSEGIPSIKKSPLQKLKRMSSSSSINASETGDANSESKADVDLENEKPLKKKPRMSFPTVGEDESVQDFESQVPTAPVPIGRYPCSECSLRFLDNNAAKLHMQLVHNVKPTYPCHLCANIYQNKNALELHVKRVHEGGTVQPSRYVCFICEEKHVHMAYKKRSLLEKHLQSVHKIDRKQIDYSRLLPTGSVVGESANGGGGENGVEEEDESPSKRLRTDEDNVTEYHCAKCSFSSKDRQEFSTHISKHRLNKNDGHQCQECGLSFTVLPSLRRHLFMVHKIRDIKLYIEKTGANLDQPSPLKNNPDTDTAVNPTSLRVIQRRTRDELQDEDRKLLMRDTGSTRQETEAMLDTLTCNVCYKSFEDSMTLKTHLKVHGMAFITSKRRKQAQWFEQAN